MSRYIVIGHWGETIVREPDHATEPCTNDGDHPGHERCAQRVATVDSGAPEGLAERICALLNGDGCTRVGMHNCAGTWSDHGHPGGRPGPPSMGVDGYAPSRPLSAPVAAQEPPVGGSGRPGGAEALSAGQIRAVGLCDQRADHHLMESCGHCPYTQLATPTFNPAYRVARCGDSSAHGPHVVDHGPDQPRNCPGTGTMTVADYAAIGRAHSARLSQRCICNDPPPTVDKPKNGTASRPDGWACPRHGAVI